MRPSLVVVQPPRFDLSPRVGQILEPVRVQALIPKASVETLDITVLHRLAGLDVDQRNPALLGPRNKAPAREFRAVVQPDVSAVADFDRLDATAPGIKIKLLRNLCLDLCGKLRKANRELSVFD